jgi:TRAP-type C4-dicarboxylate transport system substrate-binding protein
MKKCLVMFLFLCVLFIGSFGVPVFAKDVTKLTFSVYTPPTHQYAILGSKFCEEIKKRTNGRVEIAYYPGGTLTTATKVYQGVVSGVSDIGMSHIAYTRGRFPVTEVADLPIGFPSGWVATKVINEFYAKYKPKEWNDVHVLLLHGTGPNIIYTNKKPVKNLEDLKGLKIRGTGRIADTVKALGATAMPFEMADVYEGMMRGVLDGVMGPIQQLKGWKTAEVSKYATACWQIGSIFTFYIVMNKAAWNKLPADIKEIFNQVSNEFMDKFGKVANEIDIEGKEELNKFKGQLIQLSDAEAQRWVKAVEPVVKDFTNSLVSKGHNKNDVDAYIQFIRERVQYWKNKEKEMGLLTVY